MLVHVWPGREEEKETGAIPCNLNVITGDDVIAPDKRNHANESDVTTSHKLNTITHYNPIGHH